jgi:hypothetical protein
MYYTMAGTLIVIIVGTIVSYLTAPPEEVKVKPVLFAPVIRRFLKNKTDYNSTELAEKEFLNSKIKEMRIEA